jgi:VRR-NUC domain
MRRPQHLLHTNALVPRQARSVDRSRLKRRKQRPQRRHEERAIQVALVEHLHFRVAPGTWWAAISNNPRSAIAGALAKAAGCRAGIPDILLVHAGKPFALELKRPGGRLSAAQRAMHEQMRLAGCEVATAVGLDQALDALERWGLIRGGA